jgi:hypothetical protein
MKLAGYVLAFGMLAGVTGCSNDEATTPDPPDGSFCEVVLAWSDAVVGTVNNFSRVSPDAADLAARRSLYLEAWDGLAGLTAWVDAAADRGPGATRAEIHGAADRVRAEVETGRAHAVDLPDDAYSYAGVSDGTLFVTGEKSRGLVYRTLDDLRDDLGEDAVPRACGRQTEPVTLPVVTPP